MIIWLPSYPKSGNTFLRSLLSAYLLTSDGNFQINSLKQIKQFPSINLFKKFGIDTTNDLKLVENYINVQQQLNSLDKQNIRFLKTHSSFHEINGHKFTDLNNTLGVIYVVRDPRTVVKSYANHHQMSLEEAANKLFEFTTLSELTKHSKKTGERRITHVGSWASNYNTWKYFKKFNKYLLVKYENLVANPEKTFTEILNFIYMLGKSKFQIDKKKLKNTIESTSFVEMQKLEKKEGFPEAVKNTKGEDIIFFKYGPKKNNLNFLPEDLKVNIENKFKNELKELEYI